jgi:predicted transcriptional regulator
MTLKIEIVFYLSRFYLYTETIKLVKTSSFKEKFRDKFLRFIFITFSRFRELYIELQQDFKETIEINIEVGNWTKVIKDWDIMKESVIDSPLSLENPNVQRVIEVAKDILSQNKILTIERLFNISKKELNIPQPGLFSIIQFLIKNHVLIDGSKFSRKSVLDNYLRKNILEYIQLNGCAHFSLLRREVVSERDGKLGSSGQLIWHLKMLMKFNYIKKIKVGNYTVFLPIEMEVELGKTTFLMRDKINRKILDLLTAQNSVRINEIFKKIDEDRGKVNYRIKNLINYEILCFKEDSDKEVYINPDKLENINDILNQFKIN